MSNSLYITATEAESGRSRVVLLGKDEQAELALDMFCYRVKKYIGAYYAALGSVDAIVFTGGIGENSALVRSRSREGLSGLGISLDEGANHEVTGRITEMQAGGRVKILVVPTDEEREIAQQAVETIKRVKGMDR